MTVEEAFSLRDQFDWIPAPDDGRFFVTPVSNGEEDGHISLDVSNNQFVSGISFRLTSLASPDPTPEIKALIDTVGTLRLRCWTYITVRGCNPWP